MTLVALINLNRVQIPAIAPYAIDILGSALEQANHEVLVLDLTKSDDPKKSIDHFFGDNTPDIVGITLRNMGDLYFPSFLDLPSQGGFLDEHKTLIEHVKRYFSSEKIILGGVGFSVAPDKLLNRFGLQYGVKGLGEQAIVELANNFDKTGRLSDEDFKVVDGRFNTIQTDIHRDFVDNKWYYEVGGLGSIRTNNGCVMNCSYCAEPEAKGNRYSVRGTDDVIREINQLVEMGIHDIHTADSEFNLPFNKSKNVLRAIAAQQYPESVRFWAYCQPKPFDEEYAVLLRQANVTGVNFGTDHTEPDILKGLGKWYNKEDIACATNLCREHGIAVMHELLFGYPDDSPERMYKSIDFMLELDLHVLGLTIGLGVLPGTTLAKHYEQCIDSGDLSGFYIAGEPLIDPTFFVNSSFEIPRIFDDLRTYVGSDIYRVMVPQVTSTSSENNQLINSDRLKSHLKNGKKGAYWYHYRE